MKLKKDDILKILNNYNLNSKEFIIIGGAALVIQDIKKFTSDIDIATSQKLYNKLLKEYDCIFEKEIDNYSIWFIDNIINFSNHYYEDIEYIELFGYKVQTINSILKLKEKLNRSKDKKDINYIIDFLDQVNS